MIREIIKQLIYQFHQMEFPTLFDRDLNLPLFEEKITFLSGIRRCGKTSLLFKTMERLEEAGIDRRQMIYLNMEDNRLFPINRLNIEKLPEYLANMYPRLYSQPKFIFLDEIHSLKNWERQLQKLYEHLNVFLFVSGSSLKPAYSAMNSVFKGRSLFFTLYPLSFKEFLVFNGINYNYEPLSSDNMRHVFNEYLYFGGFPEVVLAESGQKFELLQESIDRIIYQDLIDRYDINNGFILKYLLKHFYSNVGKVVSINKLFVELKELGISLSKNTLYEYLSYLEDSYLIFLVSRHDESFSVQKNSLKKVFVIDNGFLLPLVASTTDLEQIRLHNTVYLKFLRNKKQVYYFKKDSQVDFIISEQNSMELLHLGGSGHNPSKMQSMFKSLKNTARHFDGSSVRFLTADKHQIEYPSTVNIQPYWEYFIFE